MTMTVTSNRTRLLCALTILHPLTDACSAALFMYAADDLWLMFLYNFIAFALQLPIGWILDSHPVSLRSLLLLSGFLLVLGPGAYWLVGDPVCAIALVCLGNAVFHVASGKRLLDDSGGKTTRVSMFISTGAIGLVAGMRFGAESPWPIIGGAILAFFVVLALSWRVLPDGLKRTSAVPLIGKLRLREVLVIALLVGIVVWRSFGVLTTTTAFAKYYRSLSLVAAFVACSWLGQFVSGWLSDRYGRIRILAISLTGSAILFWGCPKNGALIWLALLFCAQLATGPVMGILFSRCSARSGLAFGLNCLALFFSTLFIRCPLSAPHYLAGDFLAIALEFAATAWVRLPYWFGAIAFVNMCTHPALVYFIKRVGYSVGAVIVGESIVVVVEYLLLMVLYKRLHVQKLKMFGVVLWMNAVSYFIGVCMFGW